MKDYVTINNNILDEWCKSLALNSRLEKDKFAYDGIMFKGAIIPDHRNVNGVELFRWIRKSNGKENELWATSPLRILYLTKDQNTGGDKAWDVRSESFRYIDEQYEPLEMCLDTSNIFFRNLVYSLYGIVNTQPGCPAGYEFTNKQALELADRQIFFCFNCKKEVGVNKCDNHILEQAIYNEYNYCFLKQQVLNLEADLFICCGYSKSIEKTGNHMLNFLNTIGYNFKPVIEDWIFYDDEQNKAAINSYHLSYPGFNYNGMMAAYSKFLQKRSMFKMSHRG